MRITYLIDATFIISSSYIDYKTSDTKKKPNPCIRFYPGDNWVQRHKKEQKMPFSATLASIIFPARSLNKIILDDSYRPNRIVQINGLHAMI